MTAPFYSRLIIKTGNHAGKIYSLLPRRLLIGRGVRSPIWGIKLTDETVSRQHARLELIDNVWFIFDLHSANGTRVNHAPVPEEGVPLCSGDELEFGEVQAVFEG